MGVTAQDIGSDPGSRTGWYRSSGWWPDASLVDRFERLVRAAPSAPAVTDDRGALTRAQLWAEAGRLAEQFGSHGIEAGDVVLECLPNWVSWHTVFLACLRLGAIPATLPVATDADTLHYVCDLVGARAVVMPSRYRDRDTGDEAVAVARASASAVLAVGMTQSGDQLWERIPAQRAPMNAHPDGLAHVMFTSSTTGKPKAVAHTENTLAAVNIGFADRFDIAERQPIFMPSPLGHSVGAWHGSRLALFTGAPLVLQDGWDPDTALELINRHRCGFSAAATPFLNDLMAAEPPPGEPKMRYLHTFLCGGAPVPPALLESAAEQAPNTFVSVLWGMTEGGVTTCLPGDDAERRTRTAGTGLPGLELRTLSPDDQLTEDDPGELVMRGPGVFVGYLGQDDLYRELLTADGFFRTGDLAELDGGYVRITGRIKDMIIRGGVNISPLPLENQLAAHPEIDRVAVIGTPDPRLGERICAVVVPAERSPSPDLPELLTWLRDRGLPRRLWPERLIVVDQMPQTPAGKVRKADLRQQVLQGTV
ncbi:MAG: AMP-binding protein [Pseudonocardiaceae bacterium]|nr:AMP-binding protein [Pseudonocardiaceae bacterium]